MLDETHKTLGACVELCLEARIYGCEVEETIQSERWEPAELGRVECRKTFPFGRKWNTRIYTNKEVRPIFVEEADEIVVVTVYTYYS
jgi:hypothetical protein